MAVDAFLYDEADVDDLCDDGKVPRVYCTACGSHETQPLSAPCWRAAFPTSVLTLGFADFISHSFSVGELRFIFEDALGNLKGKTVVDVGSRLGPALYVGYIFPSFSSS